MRIGAAAALVAAGAALAFLASHPPNATSLYPQCVFHQLTGLHCPGCGGTRAAYLLLHGDLPSAMRQNLLAVLSVPLALWCAWATARYAVTGRWAPIRLTRAKVNVWLVVAIIAFGVLRNLPFVPFTWLAPFPIS